MEKKCIYCGSTHSTLNKWHEIEYDMPDEYGMACSEPSIPTMITMRSVICDLCNDEVEMEACGFSGEGSYIYETNE